jgi:uncharacterized damage-inducible protein DinB
MTPDMPTRDTLRLAESNLAVVGQALELVRRLSDEDYGGSDPRLPRGGVGAHFRHVIDHYDAFLRGLEPGRIDYDSRDRDAQLETRRECALAKLENVARDIARIAPYDAQRTLHVAVDCGEGAQRVWSLSSVARELQFLVSHSVHHFAVIAVMLRLRGVEPGRDFGVAPSTLKFEQAALLSPDRVVCAR